LATLAQATRRTSAADAAIVHSVAAMPPVTFVAHRHQHGDGLRLGHDLTSRDAGDEIRIQLGDAREDRGDVTLSVRHGDTGF
jgi:hypothetical protein